MTLSTNGQTQQAWVARYNNGIPNGNHQGAKIALDNFGNIYVIGFSQNASSNLGYVTVKYAPNGTKLWAARYDATNYPSATPAGLVMDNSNNVVVTGSAQTVKYDLNGNQLWTAPYAGSALAADTNGNVYITGFSTTFGTVKLSPTGTNLWLTTYTDVGPTVGQTLVLDGNGNVYVSGSDGYIADGPHYYYQIITIKYGTNGNQLWKNPDNVWLGAYAINVKGAVCDAQGNVIIVCNIDTADDLGYLTKEYACNSGLELWESTYGTNYSTSVNVKPGFTYGLTLDSGDDVLLTGQEFTGQENYPPSGRATAYGTYKLGRNGACLWTNYYPQPMIAGSAGTAIAVDNGNNVYVTGYVPGSNSGNDIATIKYDSNGNQIWVQRYNGPGNGDDEGNAIAVDNNGNVYVTGYETTAAGGTEIVTIKYSPVTLQRRSDGTVLLQAQGSPGESFDFHGSTDLLNWLDLGSMVADSNGVAQFADTNASNYNRRFYVTSPQ